MSELAVGASLSSSAVTNGGALHLVSFESDHVIAPFDPNQDGEVNTADMSAMRGELLSKLANESYVIPTRFDMNRDATINTADLSAMRGRLLQLLAASQSARPQSPKSMMIPVTQTASTEVPVRLIDRDGIVTFDDPSVQMAALLAREERPVSANFTAQDNDFQGTGDPVANDTATEINSLQGIDGAFSGTKLAMTLDLLA